LASLLWNFIVFDKYGHLVPIFSAGFRIRNFFLDPDPELFISDTDPANMKNLMKKPLDKMFIKGR
jgi:hypothetical protein